MKRLLLMAIIYASVIVPLILSREPNATKAFKKLGWTMLILTVVWGLALVRVYWNLE